MNKEIIRQARLTDLSSFLQDYHMSDIKVSGASIWLRDKPYVCTKRGYCGYVDYHTNETGNSIDFLVRYLGYSFPSAVRALTRKGSGPTGAGYKTSSTQPLFQEHRNEFVIPVSACRPYTRVVNYLCARAIPKLVTEQLIDNELLFQDALHGNAVFLSRAKDFCEIRGTMDQPGSGKKGFHGIRRKYPSCFWSIRDSNEPVEVAFICESSIDAISLYLLRNWDNLHVLEQCQPYAHKTCAYVSIGGVANQQTIDRISHSVCAVLAVDHDEAGQRCRERNADLKSIIPQGKDWNEDLMRNDGSGILSGSRA